MFSIRVPATTDRLDKVQIGEIFFPYIYNDILTAYQKGEIYVKVMVDGREKVLRLSEDFAVTVLPNIEVKVFASTSDLYVTYKKQTGRNNKTIDYVINITSDMNHKDVTGGTTVLLNTLEKGTLLCESDDFTTWGLTCSLPNEKGICILDFESNTVQKIDRPDLVEVVTFKNAKISI